MDVQLLEKLQKPFPNEDIRQREGRGRLTFSYIPIGDVIRRVLVETKGDYSWEVVKIELTQLSERLIWLCHGRLGVDGKFFDGIGTHPFLDEESAKAAESDAFKRAAVKTGVALHLYDDPHAVNKPNGHNLSQTLGRPQNGAEGASKWLGPGRCKSCDAAVGFPHKQACEVG